MYIYNASITKCDCSVAKLQTCYRVRWRWYRAETGHVNPAVNSYTQVLPHYAGTVKYFKTVKPMLKYLIAAKDLDLRIPDGLLAAVKELL